MPDFRGFKIIKVTHSKNRNETIDLYFLIIIFIVFISLFGCASNSRTAFNIIEKGRLKKLNDSRLYADSTYIDPRLIDLLNKGVDVNFSSSDGKTLLMAAAFRDQIGVMQLLIKHGADTNAKDKTGNTPLHYLCSKKFYIKYEYEVEAVELLIRNGATINIVNHEGDSPFLKAIKNGTLNVAITLYKNGATIPNGIAILYGAGTRLREVGKETEFGKYLMLSTKPHNIEFVFKTYDKKFGMDVTLEGKPIVLEVNPEAGGFYISNYEIDKLNSRWNVIITQCHRRLKGQ